MKTIFKLLNFNRRKDLTTLTQDSKWEFFIPGVNSGVYSPPTLHVSVFIKERKAGFFMLTNKKVSSEITLRPEEFDELFEQMQRINELKKQVEKESQKRKFIS